MALRQARAKPVFDDLEAWLHAQLPKISGKSPLAQAIRYTLGRMPKARPYLENRYLELDNNTAERGLTPSRNQSGARVVSGGIAKASDVNLRRALCQAAIVMMNRGRSTWLRTWGAQLAQRRGNKIAMVALARRIAVILHRIWIDGTVFQSGAAPKAA